MKINSYKILIIEPSQETRMLLSKILIANNCFVKTANSADEGIQVALKDNFNLIICQNRFTNYSAFQVFNELESDIIECGTSFFVLSDKFVNEDYIIGLEMGIDNFIHTPINEKSLLKKIENQRNKLNKTNISEVPKFKDFFQSSPVAMFAFADRRIIKINKAFTELFKIDTINGKEVMFETIFDIDEVSKNKMNFLKFENSLSDYCLLEKVKIMGEPDKYFTIYNHNVGNKKNKRFLGQVVVTHDNVDAENDDSCPIYGTCLKVANGKNTTEAIEFHLTKRENEIYELSSKGIPIKQIASNLKLSVRTVEKHRSNIMQKTDSHSIIEAILIIQRDRLMAVSENYSD